MILRIVTILIIGLFVVPCVISEDLTDGQKARSVLSPEAASDVVNKAPPASPLEQRGSLQENVVEFVEEPMEMMDESLNTTTIIIPTSATVITTDDTTTTEETTTATTESTTTTTTTATTESTTTTTTTTTATTESTTTTETTESTTTTTTTTTTTATTESTTTTTTTATTESTTTTTTTATTESTTTTTTTATTELTTTTTTSPGVSSESTTDTSAITTTTTARTSTALPLETLVNCDFSTNCFGGGAFTPTNGSEFVSDPLLSTSDPPRAPTSDASSINKPTLGNGKPCRLPYKPSLSAGNPGATSWNISFCYNGQCPTGDGETSQCEPGNYGLLSLDPTESKLTVVDPLKRSAPAPRDTEGEQCLRFYYYFTVYDGQDWGQQIALSLIRASTGFVDEIVRLTIADMQENKWYFKGTTIDRRTDADMLQVVFTTNENRNETAETNRTINFAMDSIQLFDYNCTYVEEIVDGVVRPTQTRPPLTQPPPKDDKPDLALILGLSLGIGIPVLLVVGVGTFMYLKKRKNDSANEDMEMSGETEDDAGGDDEFSF